MGKPPMLYPQPRNLDDVVNLYLDLARGVVAIYSALLEWRASGSIDSRDSRALEIQADLFWRFNRN